MFSFLLYSLFLVISLFTLKKKKSYLGKRKKKNKEKKLFMSLERFYLHSPMTSKEIGRFFSKDKKRTKYVVFHRVTNTWICEAELQQTEHALSWTQRGQMLTQNLHSTAEGEPYYTRPLVPGSQTEVTFQWTWMQPSRLRGEVKVSSSTEMQAFPSVIHPCQQSGKLSLRVWHKLLPHCQF